MNGSFHHSPEPIVRKAKCWRCSGWQAAPMEREIESKTLHQDYFDERSLTRNINSISLSSDAD